ncbi:hypothetical protein Micbo1qcDRAFT_207020 [Microdochium bolleyi]|uniref:Uncharacterized protein n=1 Tax=Microdochium bolleyi TaxID=196109 RepID=A0A136IVE0_9PEZI|nr:hypothetical protein Micbo1qcDRAFT_207020 [Microdochium bolleyi]
MSTSPRPVVKDPPAPSPLVELRFAKNAKATIPRFLLEKMENPPESQPSGNSDDFIEFPDTRSDAAHTLVHYLYKGVLEIHHEESFSISDRHGVMLAVRLVATQHGPENLVTLTNAKTKTLFREGGFDMFMMALTKHCTAAGGELNEPVFHNLLRYQLAQLYDDLVKIPKDSEGSEESENDTTLILRTERYVPEYEQAMSIMAELTNEKEATGAHEVSKLHGSLAEAKCRIDDLKKETEARRIDLKEAYAEMRLMVKKPAPRKKPAGGAKRPEQYGQFASLQLRGGKTLQVLSFILDRLNNYDSHNVAVLSSESVIKAISFDISINSGSQQAAACTLKGWMTRLHIIGRAMTNRNVANMSWQRPLIKELVRSALPSEIRPLAQGLANTA